MHSCLLLWPSIAKFWEMCFKPDVCSWTINIITKLGNRTNRFVHCWKMLIFLRCSVCFVNLGHCYSIRLSFFICILLKLLWQNVLQQLNESVFYIFHILFKCCWKFTPSNWATATFQHKFVINVNWSPEA